MHTRGVPVLDHQGPTSILIRSRTHTQGVPLEVREPCLVGPGAYETRGRRPVRHPGWDLLSMNRRHLGTLCVWVRMGAGPAPYERRATG